MTTTDTPPEHIVRAVEALIFAVDSPISADALREVISAVDEVPIPLSWIDGAIALLQTKYGAPSGVELVEIGGGWEFRTAASASRYVRQLTKEPPARLSKAALETLAVVAYRQPCTRAELEDIRGVDSAGVLRSLLERGLIRIIGKADDVGRPLVYGTSPRFLEFFGLRSLSDLPTLREYTELTEDHLVRLQELDETLRANVGADSQGDAEAARDGATALQDGLQTSPHRHNEIE